jgi:N-acyl-phosphatidylethanolamine-hydrolysing phospholipase D
MSASQDDSASQQPPRPSHHVIHPLTGTLSFKNPWPSASAPSASELLFGGAWLGWPKVHLHHHPKARELQVVEPDWGREKVKELKTEAEKQGKGDKVQFARGTWLGHASVYVELPVDVPNDSFATALRRKKRAEGKAGEGEKDDAEVEDDEVTLKMLFDPIFSERAGPTSYTGPGRLRPPPCKVEDLPGVDAVFVSHNQCVVFVLPLFGLRMKLMGRSTSYDHLDAGTVRSIMENWPRAKYFVPLGASFLPSIPPLRKLIKTLHRQQTMALRDRRPPLPDSRARLVGRSRLRSFRLRSRTRTRSQPSPPL